MLRPMLAPPSSPLDPVVVAGETIETLAQLPDASADLIVADPPYFRVLDHGWDRAWPSVAAFLDWIEALTRQLARVLRQAGNLYLFCHPNQAAAIEVRMSAHVEILGNAVWAKTSGPGLKSNKESLRAYFPISERIIHATSSGDETIGAGGYGAELDAINAEVFEPLRAYLADEWSRVGLTRADANLCTSSEMAGHWFGSSQWHLPTRDRYSRLQRRAQLIDDSALARAYDDLRAEYEQLDIEASRQRAEARENLRRFFELTPDRQYTDVWRYDQTPSKPNRHPCEKPHRMIRDIIESASRPGHLVLDPFAGSGVVGQISVETGRRYLGIDQDPHWANTARERVSEAASLAGAQRDRLALPGQIPLW